MSSGRINPLQGVHLARFARLVRFGCVGGLVFATDVTLVYLLGKVLPPIVSVSIAYVLAVCLHFGLNKWWVFEARARCNAREVISYAATAALCWGCTVLIVRAALASLTHDLVLAKMVAIIPTMLLGFGLMRLMVFRQRTPELNAVAHASGEGLNRCTDCTK